MANRRNILVLVAFLAFAGCESENLQRSTQERDKEFARLVTEITMTCDEDMPSCCNVDCKFVHPNGYQDDIRINGNIFKDTIQIVSGRKFPITLQFKLNASSNGTATQDVHLKYAYSMTIQSEEYYKGMYNIMFNADSIYPFAERGVEPDSIDSVLGRHLPVTITATVNERGEISLK